MDIFKGVFGGSSGGNNSSTTNSKSSTTYPDWYNTYAKNQIEGAVDLSKRKFDPGPTADQRYAPANAAMQTGWDATMNNGANYQPAMDAANAGLVSASQVPNAWNAGAPALESAYRQQGGYDVAQPYLNAASQTWPSAASQYVNPYLSGAIGYGNQLATQNLMEKTLPDVMSQFVTSGGQLGRQNYNNRFDQAIRNFGDSAYGNAMTATSKNFNELNNQFNSDQTRLANLGQTAGNLANNTMGQYGTLATTAANVANTGSRQGLDAATTGANVANTLSNVGLNNAAAQTTAGKDQQALDQQKRDWTEKQRQAGIQWDYQMSNFARDASAGLQIPTTSTANSTTTGTAQNTGSTSPAGAVLGTIGAIGSLPGVSNWVTGGGGSSGNSIDPNQNASGFPTGGGPQGPTGGYQRGGHFSKQKAKKFAAGGHAAVVKATAQNTKRSLDGAKVRRRAAESENEPRGVFSGRAAPKMPVMMPPAAPPPGAGGPRPPMPAMKRGGYFAGSQTRGR